MEEEGKFLKGKANSRVKLFFDNAGGTGRRPREKEKRILKGRQGGSHCPEDSPGKKLGGKSFQKDEEMFAREDGEGQIASQMGSVKRRLLEGGKESR